MNLLNIKYDIIVVMAQNDTVQVFVNVSDSAAGNKKYWARANKIVSDINDEKFKVEYYFWDIECHKITIEEVKACCSNNGLGLFRPSAPQCIIRHIKNNAIVIIISDGIINLKKIQ